MIKLGKVSVETQAIIVDPEATVVDPAICPPEKTPLTRGWAL